MAKIEWIKITTDMFEDEKITFIESLPEADSILVIWIKILTQAGKLNEGGYIFLTEKIPYTPEMLSHKFRRPLNVVKLALDTFQKLGMIEFDEENFLKITNWEKHQNIEALEKIREDNKRRVREHRQRKKLESETLALNDPSEECNVTVTLRNADVTEQTKTKTKTKNREDNIDYSKIINDFKTMCPNLPIPQKMTDSRKKTLDAWIKDSGIEQVKEVFEKVKQSDFLSGRVTSSNGWKATFDWIIKPSNRLKILEGNYDNANSEKGCINKNKIVDTTPKPNDLSIFD